MQTENPQLKSMLEKIDKQNKEAIEWQKNYADKIIENTEAKIKFK